MRLPHTDVHDPSDDVGPITSPPPGAPKAVHTCGKLGNRLFFGVSLGSAIVIVLLLGTVALFLMTASFNALSTPGTMIAQEVDFTEGRSFWPYAGIVVFGTLLISLIALSVAVPLAIGISLFISHFAPRQLSQVLGYTIDLLAAIPSVVFGLWGMKTFEPFMRPIFQWFTDHIRPLVVFIAGDQAIINGEAHWIGGLPGFNYLAEHLPWWPITPDMFTFAPPARNALMGGVILAIMILPIITSLCREVFLQTPRLQEEAALALGATRWEMITMTVLPRGRSGIVSASMLGLGRALGETMALLMVLSPGLAVNFWVMAPGQHSTIASQIALKFPESHGLESEVLIAIGLVLFTVTFGVNFIARAIVSRYAEFPGATP